MRSKALKNRFSLQFNISNALHLEAVEKLNCLGRKKSDYIAGLIHNDNLQHVKSKQNLNSLKEKTESYDTFENEILNGLKFF